MSEQFDDTKEVIERQSIQSRKGKKRWKNSFQQNTAKKNTDWATRIPLTTSDTMEHKESLFH